MERERAAAVVAGVIWLLDLPFASYDTESTGVNVEQDRIVTATIAVLTPDEPRWAVETHTYLTDPGVDIAPEATAVHGITNEHAREHGQDPRYVMGALTGHLGRVVDEDMPLVGFNIVFDLTITDRELRRHCGTGLDVAGLLGWPVIDPYVIDKWVDQWRPGKRKLTDICQHYGVRLDGAHDATFDAVAAARVAFRLAQMCAAGREQIVAFYHARRDPGEVADKFQMLADMTREQLHTNQIRWRREQCDSLRAHFDKNRTPHDGIPGDWPYLPRRTDEQQET